MYPYLFFSSHCVVRCILGCRPGIHFPLKFNVIFDAKTDIHNKILIRLVAIPKRSMLKHWNNYHLIIRSVQ